MTARLRDDPDALSVLIDRAAEHFGIRAAYIEKDFWVTEVLRVAARTRLIRLPDGNTADTTFVFKGGTSLSRVFELIRRFSEDIDLLAVFPDEASISAWHKVLKQVDTEVSSHLGVLGEVPPGGSTTGIKRYTTYRYPAEGVDVDIKEVVLLELGSRGGSHPAEVHSYRSLLSTFAFAELGENGGVWDEFVPFDVNVLAPERTLLEKLAAVHDAASRMDTVALKKGGRHFYDIYCLLANAEVRDALDVLGCDGVSALVDDINKHSDEAGFGCTARPKGGFADSPAFDSAHSSREAITAGYAAARGLIYGERIAFESVDGIVAEYRGLL